MMQRMIASGDMNPEMMKQFQAINAHSSYQTNPGQQIK
jgi:hypothetical protein